MSSGVLHIKKRSVNAIGKERSKAVTPVQNNIIQDRGNIAWSEEQR
jgi:hypothetical protein